jgi:hypothetical protein
MRKVCLVLLFSVLFNSISFAQTNRGVGIKVKDRSGKEREVKLYENSYALIIGNSNYKYWDVLNGVKSDVVAVEKALKENGFLVETAIDLDSRSLSPRIEQFVRDHGYEENNRLLIYYAGHGYTQKSVSDDRELGYIVPIDSPNPTKDRVGFLRTAVDLEEIRTFAKKIQSKHALFLFDSCFSGKLVSRGEIAVPPIIEESIAYPVRQFITAGSANQTVPDESIFRRAFIRGLEGEADLNKDGFILGSELASYLRDRVTNYSSRQQTPLYAKIDDISLDRGDFVFKVGKIIVNNTQANVASNLIEKAKLLLRYDNINAISEGLIEVTIKGKKGAINEAGKVIISPIYDEIGDYSEGFLPVKANAKWGFIDLKGNVIIPLKYDKVGFFSEGLAMVAVGKETISSESNVKIFVGKFGFVDPYGKTVIPLNFDDAGFFSEGLAPVKQNDNWGYINKLGKTIIPFKYKFASSFLPDGFANVSNEIFDSGIIDKTGNEIIPIEYDIFPDLITLVRNNSYFDKSNLLRVKKNDKCGFVNKQGTIAVPLNYDQCGPSFEELAAVRNKDKWGFVDKSGKLAIPFKYDDVGPYFNGESFSEGLCPVYLNNKVSYINKSGETVIPFFYDFGSRFAQGVTIVSLNGKKGYIDSTGREITPIKYDRVSDGLLGSYFSSGLAEVKLNNKIGFINKEGKEVISSIYDEIWCRYFMDEGLIGVKRNNQKGFVDHQGNEYFFDN